MLLPNPSFRKLPSLGIICAFFLGACAPAPATPPGNLGKSLQALTRQQQQQAEQIQALQQQIEQLRQQLAGEVAIASQIETGQGQLPKQPVTVTPTRSAPPATEQELTDLADSAAIYLAAFSNLAAARYPQAETGFENFLNLYPEHRYAPNARYWLASAQAAQGRVPDAMSNLRQIIVDPQGQAKAPAALAQLAKLYRQQDMEPAALEVLEQLRSRYPDSPEAQQFDRSDVPQ